MNFDTLLIVCYFKSSSFFSSVIFYLKNTIHTNSVNENVNIPFTVRYPSKINPNKQRKPILKPKDQSFVMSPFAHVCYYLLLYSLYFINVKCFTIKLSNKQINLHSAILCFFSIYHFMNLL